jgi:hypothetical protein
VRGSLIIGDNCAVQGGTAWREVSVDSQAGPRFLFPGAGAFLASPCECECDACVCVSVCDRGSANISGPVVGPRDDSKTTQKKKKCCKQGAPLAIHGGCGRGGEI